MKKYIGVSVAVLMLVSGIVAGGFAMRHIASMTPEKKVDFIVNKLSKDLALTKDQKTAIDRIKSEIVDKMYQHREDRMKAHDEALALIRNDSISTKELNDFFDRRRDKMEELRPFAIEKLIEVHSLLTSEQRNKLADKIENFKGCFRH